MCDPRAPHQFGSKICSTPGDRSASKQKGGSPKAMSQPEHEFLSSAEIRDMLECSRPATFFLWEDGDPPQARRSETGVPCGTELRPRGLINGWEVCERCIRRPSLKCALLTWLK